MEYEFRRDRITGALLANFSMGQEAFGTWLVEELGDSSTRYEELCQIITQLQLNQLPHWRKAGKSLSIELNAEEVRVFANDLEGQDEFELEEAMSLYNDESEAICGLHDFLAALESWRVFIDDSH
mgnify:CR=1 FL=1